MAAKGKLRAQSLVGQRVSNALANMKVPTFASAPAAPSFGGGGGGGGGRGGGGGGGLDPNVNWDYIRALAIQQRMAADPNLHNELAGYQLQESQARAKADADAATIDTELAVQQPRLATQGGEERRALNAGFESRGVLRSGERLRREALQSESEQQRAADMQRTAANNKAQVQFGLQSLLAELAQRRVQAQLDAQARASAM